MKGLGDGQRLSNAGGLNQDVVELEFGQGAKLLQEVFAQSAADATVRHLDHLLRSEAHQLGIHIDLAELIHNYCNLFPVLGAQQMVDQGGLASSQKAYQHRGRYRRFVHSFSSLKRTCLRALESYFLRVNFSGVFLRFFCVTKNVPVPTVETI
ncbi:Uncharacterised protein [Acinetobacter baumannii]|nr:Uncharacterised protein [Acinetobacter baumannii]